MISFLDFLYDLFGFVFCFVVLVVVVLMFCLASLWLS